MWLSNIDQAVLGSNPKQTCTLKEGDTAYTFQQNSNASGRYLLVAVLRLGGLIGRQGDEWMEGF